jgi:Mg2+ and Co2+ transporter CorA
MSTGKTPGRRCRGAFAAARELFLFVFALDLVKDNRSVQDRGSPAEETMARRRIKRSAKSGLPPGTLVHIGERHVEEPRITLIRYEGEHFEEHAVTAGQVVRPPRDQGGVAWYHVAGLHDVKILERLGEVFGLHPLILEDILNTEQRPKSDEGDDYLCVGLKGLISAEEPGGDLVSEQISIVLGSNWILSLQEREGNRFGTLRDRIAASRGGSAATVPTTWPTPSWTRWWTAISPSWRSGGSGSRRGRRRSSSVPVQRRCTPFST